jgi:hypothetical protein
MTDVTFVEKFPKDSVKREDVEAERQLKLRLAGTKSSTITEDDSDWLLTTVVEVGDDDTGGGAAAGSSDANGTGDSPAPMTGDLKQAMRTALRLNEIGDVSPYRLSFAGKGASGASFGFTQGDMAAGQPIVQTTFQRALRSSAVAEANIVDLARRLSVHLIANPLSPAETNLVNDALSAAGGRAAVDQMDESIFEGLFGEVDKCLAAAAQTGRTVAPKAQICMLLWINMTGPPTRLLDWLSGKPVTMARPVPSPGKIVDAAAIETYLRATDYFSENPNNLPHFLQSVAAGANFLSQTLAAPAFAPAPPAAPEPSGAQWCTRFPGSKSVDDLVEPFKTSIRRFLAALNAVTSATVRVDIAATFRPPERAYLMHYAWCIANRIVQPANVPAMSGVDIVWDHPDATSAAQAMVRGYGMAAMAALVSNHTKRLAVDMDVTWSNAMTIKQADGSDRRIDSTPRDNGNLELQQVAGGYGVLKLASDPPHWSVNGH